MISLNISFLTLIERALKLLYILAHKKDIHQILKIFLLLRVDDYYALEFIIGFDFKWKEVPKIRSYNR